MRAIFEPLVGYANSMCFKSVARIPKRMASAKRLITSSASEEYAAIRELIGIKGRVKRKNNSGDWKDQKCLLRSPAHVMLRGSGVFVPRSIKGRVKRKNNSGDW